LTNAYNYTLNILIIKNIFLEKEMTGSFISYFFTNFYAAILLSLHFLETLYICNYKYFHMKMYIRICIINKVITKT